MAEYTVRAPADKNDIKAVLGDAASSTFVPRLKLSRWNGEVEFGVEHDLAGITGSKNFSQVGDKYTLDTSRLTLNFYPKSNAYEYELILKQRPGTNVISLPISYKGLKFFYQAPLTERYTVGTVLPNGRTIATVTATDVIDSTGRVIVHRPEDVVGSYAVYHASKSGDFGPAGGMNYRCGKVVHIYRPKLTDALGKETWADVKVDEAAGRLIITAPQAFLDTATYPVIVDPTFGCDPGSPPSTEYGLDANYMETVQYTAPTGAVSATSISAYQRGYSAGVNMKGVILTHSDLNLLTNGVGAAETLGASIAWHTSTFSSSPSISGGTDYLLGLIADNYTYGYYDDGASILHRDSTNSYTTPANMGSATTLAYVLGIYCTYSGTASITLFGEESTPADNGTNTTDPTAVTPPSSMQAGDLVFVTATCRNASATIAVSNAGGQSWTSLTGRTTTNHTSRSFWCVFDGTWDANPSFSFGNTTNNVVRMLVFRPIGGTNSTWEVDASESSGTTAAPSSPYTCTISEITTATDGALVIAAWASSDDNTWGSLAGSTHTWTAISPAQVRNTSGSDASQTHAWLVDASHGATGSVSQNQATYGGDNFYYCIIAFKEVALAINLVPNEGAQTQGSDSPDLTQLHILSPQEGAQTQASDQATLTFPAIDLVPAEGAQTQGSDQATVTVNPIDLQPAEGAQTQGSDTPSLTQLHILAPDEGAQSQASDQSSVTVAPIDLVPAEGNQTQGSDTPALTQLHILAPDEAAQTQLSDQAAITVQGIDLVPAENAQTQGSDSPDLTQVHILAPAENAQTQASDTPNLTQLHILSPAEGAQEQGSDQATLEVGVIVLAPNEGFQTQGSDAPALTQEHNLVPDEAYQTHYSAPNTLEVVGATIDLVPEENYQGQFSESPSHLCQLPGTEPAWPAGLPTLEGAWPTTPVPLEAVWPQGSALGFLVLGLGALGGADPVPSLEAEWPLGTPALEAAWPAGDPLLEEAAGPCFPEGT